MPPLTIFIIGIGKILPGISGAFLAIILKVYDKGLNAIIHFNKNAKGNKWQGNLNVIAWRERDKPYTGNSKKKTLEWCDVYFKCPYFSEVITEHCSMGHDSTEHYCKKSGELRQIIPYMHCKRCIDENKNCINEYSND